VKVLCALLPHFPLRCELRRHPELRIDSTVILQSKDTAGSQKLVLDFSPELEGLQSGMPLQMALSRHAGVELLQADMPYYRSIFNEILDLLEEKCPLVEGSGLGTAYLGVNGLHLLYPDNEALISAIREAIPESFIAQMGIAEGKFPAYLAALYSSPDAYRILVGDIGAFLKDLSCDVLPVSLKAKGKLHEFGLHTLGHLMELPSGPFQSQFGTEGKRIRELAMGYDNTPLFPRLIEEVIEENTTLSSVTVSLEALMVSWESLLSRVFDRLAPRGMGIRSLTLWTMTWRSEHWERSIQFKEPAMDVRSVISRLKPVLENAPQPGPVERLGMKIIGLGRRGGRQKSLFSDVRARERLLDDIKQLDLRLGGPQVFKIKEVEPWSRIPERRYVLTSASGG
jgi:DNA polymerase-4